MTKNNKNNRAESKNTRNNNTRSEKAAKKSAEVLVHVESEHVIATPNPTATEKAANQAKRQADAEAKRKQAQEAREREERLRSKFVELTMSPNEAVRAIAAHTKDTLEDGLTVGDWMKEYNWAKLTLKGLIEAVKKAAPELVQEGKLMLPTVKCATYDAGSPEDDQNGKPVYYFVVKGKGKDAKRTYKKAQTYGLAEIKLWTPKVVLSLLKAAMTYTDKQAHYAKRNAEVKAAKQFYIVNDIAENSTSTKVADKSTRTTTYTRIESANVKWAE